MRLVQYRDHETAITILAAAVVFGNFGSSKHVAATAGGNLVQVFEVPERPVAMEDELTIVS